MITSTDTTIWGTPAMALDYFLFFAAIWGLSAGIAFSKIVSPVIEVIQKLGEKSKAALFFGELLGCPMCTGWHFAWIGVWFGFAPGPRTLGHGFAIAFAAAGINLLLALAVEKLGDRS